MRIGGNASCPPLSSNAGKTVQRRLEELRAWRNQRESAIPDWTFTASDGVLRAVHVGDFWPVIEVPVNLQATGTIPAEWSGQTVELELWLGGEGFVRLSTGYRPVSIRCTTDFL